MPGVLIRGNLYTDMRGHRGRVMGRHREKRALYKPRREALEKNNPADTLIADLWRRAM